MRGGEIERDTPPAHWLVVRTAADRHRSSQPDYYRNHGPLETIKPSTGLGLGGQFVWSICSHAAAATTTIVCLSPGGRFSARQSSQIRALLFYLTLNGH